MIKLLRVAGGLLVLLALMLVSYSAMKVARLDQLPDGAAAAPERIAIGEARNRSAIAALIVTLGAVACFAAPRFVRQR